MAKKQKQARPQVTDVSAVALNGNTGTPVVSESNIEIADLICEGPIQGLVSGRYDYYGKLGETGFRKVTTPDAYSDFGTYASENVYTATGLGNTNSTDLGFLRSVYWNQIPVVDNDGYYNFNQVDIHYAKGDPAGTIPSLNPLMGSSSEVLDLSVHRNIGERLYGPDIKGGDDAPSTEIPAQLKDNTRIDKNAKTYNIYNRECSSLVINVKINTLQEHIRKGPKTYRSNNELNKHGPAAVGYGDIKARSIVYYIYYQPIFDQRFNSASDVSKNANTNTSTSTKDKSAKWYGPVKEVVTGKIDQGYIRSTKITLEDAGEFKDQDGFDGWRVRIVRTTPEPLTSFFRAISFVDSIVEIYGTKLRYPYSAMVYSKFDAANFNRVPSRSYDTKLQKVKIPNNYDPIKKTYGKSDAGTTDGGASNNYGTDPANFWDGEFHTEKYWSDNPAWCFYDILTNERYGLGEYVNETEIDKWALYEIAQYCDELVADGYGGLEPRFTLNHLITNREEAYKLINDLASAFRGLAYFANGLIFTVQDSFKKPIYQLNNSSVVDGDFSYSSSSKKARHTVAIVRYIDKKNFFQPAVEYVSDEEGIKRYGIRQVETSAIGCTSRGQARRFGLWILASEKDETETVNFKMGTDGSYLKPGDIIQIFDNNVSSLKYSGRTNAISGLAFAATPPANEGGPASRFSSAYDSVILDSALNFSADKIYTFSLLTPTFNYDASVSDLNSSGIKEIRRSHLQTLHFRGDCVRTRTGEFKSNLELGGSGVCTQIFFKTGAPFDTSYFNNADFDTPTGNRLDFDNYVITGYVNAGVNIDTNANTKVEYSGGYYNGEGLVWSIEPYDEDIDGEFSKGSFSNYRLINIKENTDQTYDVSALQYFSGKYDNVENKIAFDNPFLDKNPQTPKGLKVTRKDPTSDGTVLKEYELLNVSFDVIGYVGETNLNEGIDYLISIKTGQNYTKTPPIFNDAGVNIEAGRDLGYEITAAGDFDFMGATGYETYHKPYRQAVINPKDPNVLAVGNDKRIDVDFFITEETDYYISVFAISPYGVLSEKGIVGELDSELIQGAQSLINRTNIFGLTTDNITTVAGGTPGAKPGNTQKNIPANNPVFTWQVGADTTFDQKGVYINNQDINYRITIREPKKDNNVNIPSSNIYFEFTGQNATNFNSPQFRFSTDFNNPNLYTDIETAISNSQSNVSEVEGKGGKSYYRVDETGFLIQKGLKLPLRDFDIVVEAHDSVGRTSVGKGLSQNRVFYNTIFTRQNGTQLEFPGESFAKDQADQYFGYDILGVSIDSISGIVFPNRSNMQREEVTSDRAFDLNYRYLANLDTLPDGYMHLTLDESQDLSTNEVIRTKEEIEDMFADAAGVVFYYTTGSEDLKNLGTEDSPEYQAIFRAKPFTLDPEKIDQSIGARNFGLAETNNPGGPISCAISLPETTDPNYSKVKETLMSGVFREYALLQPGQTVDDLRIKFQKSKVKGVENAQICMGVFDQLSYLAHFNEDNTPKTKAVQYQKQGSTATYNVPTIFSDSSINFSTIPKFTDQVLPASTDPFDVGFNENNIFTPTSYFVIEKSIITARDKDLAYKAWFDIEIDEFFSLGGTYPPFPGAGGDVIRFKGGIGKFTPRDARYTEYPVGFSSGGDNTPNDTFKMPKVLAGRNIQSIEFDYHVTKPELSHEGNRGTAEWKEGETDPWGADTKAIGTSFLKVNFFEPLSRAIYLPMLDMTSERFQAHESYNPRHPYPTTDLITSAMADAAYMNWQAGVVNDQMNDINASLGHQITDSNWGIDNLGSVIIGNAKVQGQAIGKSFQIIETHPEYLIIQINHGTQQTRTSGLGTGWDQRIRIFGGILENSLNDQV